MSEVAKQKNCPVCSSSNLRTFLELTQLPIYCNLLWPESDSARHCPKGDITLELCLDCGFIYNSSFDPNLLAYSQDYENSLHYSQRFQDYANQLAEKLVEKHQLYGKTILEIGCGKGDFLESLCRLGKNSGIGFDNSYVSRAEHTDLDIVFIQDFYSKQYAEYQGDFICCRQVLEHIQDPSELLNLVKTVIKNKEKIALFFEVPNTTYILRDLAIWDIIYEHCNYFTEVSLRYVFEKAGFLVNEVTEEFGGQFLGIEVKPTTINENISVAKSNDLESLVNVVEGFRQRFNEKVEAFKERLFKLHQASKKIAVWGAGSKGVMFLNLLGDENFTSCAVDINPRKQGKFVAGTGQPIIAPENLRDMPVDVVLVMNPLYQHEIQASLANLGLHPELILI